jgi:hypothetical protein
MENCILGELSTVQVVMLNVAAGCDGWRVASSFG